MPGAGRGTPRAREELDGFVVSAELTLISIIQGTALYFLTNTAFPEIVVLHWRLAPYLLAGLAVILLFWSRAILHTLTIISWPLEFGHNFLYIAATLIEAVMFTQLADSLAWHAVGAVFWGLIWFLFAFDMRMIRRARALPHGPEAARLLGMLEEEQKANVRWVLPAATLFYLAAAVLLARRPGAGRLAFLLGAGQAAGLFAYLAYTMRFYARIAPLILPARAEEEA